MIRYIEKSELKEFFQLGSDSGDESLLEEMIREADQNQDNLISIAEFKNIISVFYDNLNK